MTEPNGIPDGTPDVRVGDTVKYSVEGVLRGFKYQDNDAGSGVIIRVDINLDRKEDSIYDEYISLDVRDFAKLEILARKPKAIGSLWKHPDPKTSDQDGVFIYMGDDATGGYYTKVGESRYISAYEKDTNTYPVTVNVYFGGWDFIPATEADLTR